MEERAKKMEHEDDLFIEVNPEAIKKRVVQPLSDHTDMVGAVPNMDEAEAAFPDEMTYSVKSEKLQTIVSEMKTKEQGIDTLMEEGSSEERLTAMKLKIMMGDYIDGVEEVHEEIKKRVTQALEPSHPNNMMPQNNMATEKPTIQGGDAETTQLQSDNNEGDPLLQKLDELIRLGEQILERLDTLIGDLSNDSKQEQYNNVQQHHVSQRQMM